MPASLASSDQLLRLAELLGVSIPERVLGAVQSAPKGSELQLWVQRLLDSTSALDDETASNAVGPRAHGPDDTNAEDLRSFHHDLDLRHAINTLDASTQQFNLRIRVLTTQQTLLAPRSIDRDAIQDPQRLAKDSSTISQAQRTRLLNEAKSDELISNINAKREAIDKEVASLPTTITERLRADDRLFELLEQKTPASSIPACFSERSTRVQQLSTILQTKHASAVKHRLDRLYLHALAEASADDIDPGEAAEAIPDLKRDIQSLYTEINDVVAMSVGQEHTNKVQRVIAHARREQQQKSEQSLQLALSKISRMVHQLAAFLLQAERLQEQRQALHQISVHAATLAAAHTTTGGSSVPDQSMLDAAPQDHVEKRNLLQPGAVERALFDNAALSGMVTSTIQCMEEARRQRSHALALLQAVDRPTKATELDALDRRIAATNRSFEAITKLPDIH